MFSLVFASTFHIFHLSTLTLYYQQLSQSFFKHTDIQTIMIISSGYEWTFARTETMQQQKSVTVYDLRGDIMNM